MKITDIKIYVTCPKRNFVLLKIMTDAGIYGVGDATLNGRELAVYTLLKEHLGPWLIGKDPDQIEDIWQSIFRGTYWRGGPVTMTALAGLNMALWDIKGKRAGLPVYSLLGGKSRTKVKTYLHVHGNSPEKILERCYKRMEMGCEVVRVSFDFTNYKGIKITQPHQDIETGKRIEVDQETVVGDYQVWDSESYLYYVPRLFKYLREKLGDNIWFIHDVHGRLAPIQAAMLAKNLESYGFYFLEDPVRPKHKNSLYLIRQHSSIPIGMGELFFDKWECLDVLQKQLVDYIRVDICHCGGISEVKKIAAIAECFNIKVALHGPSDCSPIAHAANVHMDYAIPNFGIQEFVFHDDLTYQIIHGSPQFKDGYLYVSDEPGLGVDFDENKAMEFPYKHQYIPILRDLEGGLHDW